MNRKQRIADIALKLFAERGYESTSTQLIAKESEVSEALIFKHFGNKEQLLNAIIKNGYKRIVEQNRGMMQEKDPLSFIFKIIDLPYKLITDEPDFWKLQNRLMDMEVAQTQYDRFLQPVFALLKKAFSELGYSNPEKETEFLLMLVEALWKFQIRKSEETEPVQNMLNFIKTKYASQK